MDNQNNCIDCGNFGTVCEKTGQCDACDKLIDDIIAHATEYCSICNKFLEYDTYPHLDPIYGDSCVITFGDCIICKEREFINPCCYDESKINRCTQCNVNLGVDNPRQLCRKTYCGNGV